MLLYVLLYRTNTGPLTQISQFLITVKDEKLILIQTLKVQNSVFKIIYGTKIVKKNQQCSLIFVSVIIV